MTTSSSDTIHHPRGIIVPIVTPFDELGALDLAAYGRVLQFVRQGGVDAIFTLGTTGEGPSLSAEEQKAVVRHTCDYASDCPVYVGATHASDRETLKLVDYALECGATAAVIAPPPYFPAGVKGQVAYFQSLADASSLPVILYNIPQLTKTPISLEAFQELLWHPRIIGIKDSSGSMVYFRRLQFRAAARDCFAVLIGADELLAEAVLLGAHGGVTGGANIAPGLFRDLFLAASRRDLTEVMRLQQRVMELSCSLYTTGEGGYVIQGLKAVLALRKLCDAAMRVPLLGGDEALLSAAALAETRFR